MAPKKLFTLIAVLVILFDIWLITRYSRRIHLEDWIPELPATTPSSSPSGSPRPSASVSSSPVPMNRIVFLRIPKCSGTSVSRLLMHLLPRGNCRGFGLSQAGAPPECTLFPPCSDWLPNQGECNVVTDSHCDYYDLFESMDSSFHIQSPGLFTITWVRDPVRRVLSEWKEFFFQSDTLDHCLGDERWKATEESFLKFLRHPDHVRSMKNRQTQMLAGCGSRACSDIYDTDLEMLQAAKDHLSQLDFVGVTERFDDSVRLLEKILNQDIRNVEPQRVSLDEVNWEDYVDVHDAIRDYNSLDFQLHIYALSLLSERMKTNNVPSSQ